MEFFEKAHVVKNKNSSHRDHKSNEKLKQQLKQMLFGYKDTKNDLIKKFVADNTEDDDSSSVSGFSDLNLTDSSLGLNDSREVLSPNIMVSDFNDSNFDKPSNENDVDDEVSETESESEAEECFDSSSVQSISECENSDESLSENMPREYLSTSEDTSLDSSLLETCTDTDTEDELFDNDGTLADKIKEKLKNIAKVSEPHRKNKININKGIKSKRRKINDESVAELSQDVTEYKGPYNPNNVDVIVMDVEDEDTLDSANILVLNKYRGPLRPKDVTESSEEDQNNKTDNSVLENNIADVSLLNQSPEYISVTATDIPSQSFEELLGEYKYPTVKNLPTESRNFIKSTNNAGTFTAEDLSFSKVVLEEDADSLVPEVDDDVAVEDIDLEAARSKIILEAITNKPANDSEIDTSAQIRESQLAPSTQDVEDTTACDSTFNTDQDSDKDMSVSSVDTTFVNPVKVYYGKNCCIFVLKHPTDIYIHGKVKIKCMGGTVEVLGYTLKDGFYELYAPNYNYAQYLRTVENENSFYGLFGKLTSSGLLVSEAEEIVTSIGDYDGIICLQPLKKRKIDFVEKYFTAGDLFSKQNKSGQCFKKASEKLSCTLYSIMPWRSFSVHPSWKQVVNAGSENKSRTIICGGKGVGKSTFLRYYINKQLANGPILLIDLDPGQCELTVAGNVSATVISEPLLGPNFTHLKTPDLMLNLGMINTMDNSRRYAKAVEMLIAHCLSDERLSQLPWVINTMGMCNAMGQKFISLIIFNAKPTVLLQIDSKNPKQRFENLLKADKIKELYFNNYRNDPLFANVENVDSLDYLFVFSHRSESLVKNNFSLAPRDERYLNFLAYFGELVDTHNDSLLGIVPYEVSLKDLNIGANVKINREDVAKVINGKIVALCQQSDDTGVFTLGDKPFRCYGHGLIRGIDWERQLAYVLSPVSGAALCAVNTLVYSDWAPEVRGQESHIPPHTAIPYRTASQYHNRQLTFAPKRRFNPLQLLKMRAA